MSWHLPFNELNKVRLPYNIGCLYDTNRVYTSLREQGIMVKHFPVAGNFKNCMRVTVGTPRENEMFLGTLERIIAE